jgi:dipeptidyl aminopeptidase/acylaminoacyl peptidase
MKTLIKGLILTLGIACFGSPRAVEIDHYVRKDKFESIKLSPKGDYYAATVPLEDRTVLAIISRADNKLTGHFAMGKHTHVEDFWWVNDERVVISIAEKFGTLDRPGLTGELYAIDADGGNSDILVGQRVQGAGLGTKIQPKKVERVAAFLVDALPDHAKDIVIAVMPFSDDPYSRAERLDVYTGRRSPIVRAPVRNADFITDNRGVVRFATGFGVDNVRKVYHRAGEGAEWKLVSDEAATGLKNFPIGFAEDDRIAYFEVETKEGPNAIVEFDSATGERKQLLRDDEVDPAHYIYRNGTSIPVGAFFMDGRPRTQFFDANSPEARLYRSLEATFEGHAVHVTSQTKDGSLALVQLVSDRNPGDFYLFDTVNKKADFLLSRAEWFDPAERAPMRPISLQARDGLALHGYLTVPHGADEKNLPLIVMPHGGPYGIQDVWTFNGDVQMLADAGYAVLQLNFRGSGGYGRAFTSAGARQWGLAMQDDVTDATRWAIREGIANANRVCIYGGSYGGYAALMGAAKEPDLYRCAVGYVGVYDLPTMHTQGDVQRRGSGETYIREWIGERADLGATSPNRLADRIKVPVFLAAGGKDERAPVEHTKMMEKALRNAGAAVEALYFDTEGHGFYLEKNRREYYTRLLAFLSRHLGGRSASAGTASAAGSSSAK